jgi:V/A-type H+-transporting ATPase subunit E
VSEVAEVADSQAIVRAILKVAEDRAGAILGEARRRAREIVESAKREAEQIVRARRERAEREMREEIARRKSAAEVEANQRILRVKKEIIDDLIRLLQERLQSIADGEDPNWDYREILRDYCLEGIKALGGGEIYLIGREKDRELLEEIARELGANVKVDPRSLPIIGGVILRDSRDERRYYNTFDGRLRGYLERKMPYIIERIFGGI